MIRKAHIFKLYPGKAAEYQRRHDELWPEMREELIKHGADHYSIFLREATNELFAYVEIADEKQWAGMAQTDVCRRWWAYMKDLMETHPDNRPTSEPLVEVFHLEKKPRKG